MTKKTQITYWPLFIYSETSSVSTSDTVRRLWASICTAWVSKFEACGSTNIKSSGVSVWAECRRFIGIIIFCSSAYTRRCEYDRRFCLYLMFPLGVCAGKDLQQLCRECRYYTVRLCHRWCWSWGSCYGEPLDGDERFGFVGGGWRRVSLLLTYSLWYCSCRNYLYVVQE